MGEARRRGTRAQRRNKPKGTGWKWLDKIKAAFIPEANVRYRSDVPKRDRAKAKRAFKRRYGLTRRDCGFIGAMMEGYR